MNKTVSHALLALTVIMYLGSCGKSPDSTASPSQNPQTAQLDSAFEAMMNPPVPQSLTETILDTTSNENLPYVVFLNLSSQLPEDYEKEYEAVLAWNTGRQAIFMVWILEGEVNNGGHNQFYANTSGQYAEHLPQALRLIGAPEHASLMLRANATYLKEYETINRYQDGSAEGFSKSYQNNPLNVYDDEFYELEDSENLQKLMAAYIRAHKKEFITP